MRVLDMPNGEHQIVTSDDDFANIVYQYMGYDAYIYTQDLIKRTEEAYHKVDTDFDAYEHQLDSQTTALRDILEIAELADNYLLDTKRIDREKLAKYLTEIQNLVTNEI